MRALWNRLRKKENLAIILACLVLVGYVPLLLKVIQVADGFGAGGPGRVFLIVAGVSLGILWLIASLFRIKTQNMILQAYLEEAGKREEIVDQKNRELHRQIAERERVEAE
ncbi:MAG: hypothetical protein PVI27_00385, partial [Desulfobacteraceae bacterium]